LATGRTTGLRILIYQFDEENERCNGSNHLVQPTLQSTISSTFNAT